MNTATTKSKTYHHGDLPAALLQAAEEVLTEDGLEGFSLRKVAKRVGVSHAAPAHHFGDTNGLLTALAAAGFARFRDAMAARQAASGSDDPTDLLVASGLGYIDFACSAPALFRLMFTSDRVGSPGKDKPDNSLDAFEFLVADIARLRGVSPWADDGAMRDVMSAWSLAHGLAELLISGRLAYLDALSPADREAALSDILRRSPLSA